MCQFVSCVSPAFMLPILAALLHCLKPDNISTHPIIVVEA